MSENDGESLTSLLKEIDALPTPEEKEAHLLKFFENKNKKDPQVIGLPENASAEGAEPCL